MPIECVRVAESIKRSTEYAVVYHDEFDDIIDSNYHDKRSDAEKDYASAEFSYYGAPVAYITLERQKSIWTYFKGIEGSESLDERTYEELAKKSAD